MEIHEFIEEWSVLFDDRDDMEHERLLYEMERDLKKVIESAKNEK